VAYCGIASHAVTTAGGDRRKNFRQQGRSASGSNEPPVAPSSDSFADELAAAFRRHRPQGSARWNFSAAFTRLEERFGSRPAAPDLGNGAVPESEGAVGGANGTGAPAGARGLLHRLADRYVTGRLQPWIAEQVGASPDRATEDALADERKAVAEGFDAVIEALRFLGARVEQLEEAVARRSAPVDAVGALAPTPTGSWARPVADWLVALSPEGPVLHGECGGGELVVALAAGGIDAKGVEPRGDIAWQAADQGAPVVVGELPDLLGGQPPGSLGGLVLSGVVDRLPIDELVALVEVSGARLADGAPVVVVGTNPEAAAGWDAAARDLLPGRPLHAETWELLLARAGFVDVGRLELGSDGGPVYVVTARRPS
jgi:hypothetical protein